MRIFKIILYTVWLLLLAVLQPTLIQWIEIFGVSPNIFLVFTVAAAFLRGKEEGVACGFVFGIVFDLMIGRMVGLSAIVFMYIAFAAGIFKERFYSGTGGLSAAIITAAAAAVYDVVYYIAYSMVWGDIGFWSAVLRIILPEIIYTAAAAFVLLVPIRKSFSLLRDRRFKF